MTEEIQQNQKQIRIIFDIETTGLKPVFSDRITCICVKAVYPNGDHIGFKKSVRDRDSFGNLIHNELICERKLLHDFRGWFLQVCQESRKTGPVELVSHNGKAFDVPFLVSRCFAHGLDEDKSLWNALVKSKHSDSIEYLKKWIKLDEYAAILGIQRKSGNGLNAIKLYQEGRFDELEDYCWQDVVVTDEVDQKLKKNGDLHNLSKSV